MHDLNEAKGDENGRFCRILADWLDTPFTPSYITTDPHIEQYRPKEVQFQYDNRYDTETRCCMTSALLENQTIDGQSARVVAIRAIFDPSLQHFHY